MDQIFRDHLPFIIGGLLLGTGAMLAPGQARRARRMSSLLFILACAYPCAIAALYLRRDRLGESYAHLIYGDVIAIAFASLAGIAAVVWFASCRPPIRRP